MQGGRIKEVARGSGANDTTPVVSYADGRTKETSLNGVVKTAYEYGPNWTKTYEGPAGLASPRCARQSGEAVSSPHQMKTNLYGRICRKRI